MKTFSLSKTMLMTVMLMLSISACSPQAEPVESIKTDQYQSSQPAAATQVQETGSNTAITCEKIMPPDEASLLLNQVPATLTENAAPGETTCTWQYTSQNGNPGQLQIWAGYNGTALATWEDLRKAEVTTQPSDLQIIQIDGLGDENYAWTSIPDNQQVVYVRRGTQAIIMHFQAADVLYLANEAGIIDISDRVFTRLGS